MPRTHRCLLLLWAVSGCKPAVYLEAPEPPANLRFVGALAYDEEDGGFVSGSNIVERSERWRLELLHDTSPDALAVEMVGWTGDLRPATLGAPGDLGEIHAAAECETKLRAPDWRHPLQGQVSEAWPSLTSSGLATHCPRLLEVETAEPFQLCGRNHCGQSVEQVGCELLLHTAGCGLERSVTRAVVDAYGGLCFETETGCTSVEAPKAVHRRFECYGPGECRIDWVRPSSTTPALSVLTRTLVAVEPFPSMATLAQPSDARFGPLQDLMVAEDRVLVFRRETERGTFGASSLPAHLVTLERDTLATRSEVPLPAGLTGLAWAPDHQSLVGVRLAPIGEQDQVLRFDLEGNILETRPFGEAPILHRGEVFLFEDLPELGAYLVLLRVSGGATIAMIDRDTLETQSACIADFDLRPTDVVAAPPDELWFSENSNDYLPRVRASDCARTGGMALSTPGNFGLGFFLERPDTQGVLLTLGGISGNTVSEGVLADAQTFPVGGASFYESFMIPTQLALDGTHPGLALAALHTSEGIGPARVAWYDLEAQVFLPGSQAIARGMVARIESTGDGVFFLLMGRGGDIVRVDTR